MKFLSVTLPDEDRFTDADVNLIRQLQPGDGMVFLRYASDKGSCGQVVELVPELGHKVLLVRMMQVGIHRIPADHWAEQCRERLAPLEPLEDVGVRLHVIPGNEVNLIDEEHGHKDFERWGNYWRHFGQAWNVHVARFPLHLPAPSRQFDAGGNNESVLYWEWCKSQGALHFYDYVDIHAYGNDFFTAQDEAKAVFGPPSTYDFWVTETNRCPMSWANEPQQDVRGCVWFTSSWRQYNDQGGVEGNQFIPGMTIDTDPFLQLEYAALDSGSVVETEDPDASETPVETGNPDASDPSIETGNALAWDRDRVIQFCVDKATEAGLPPIYVLGAAIAESNLRTNARRPDVPEKDPEFWPDVSGGLWQQTVRWDVEYTSNSAYGPGYPGPEVVEHFLQRYYDPEEAWERARWQLEFYLEQEGGHFVNALCRYNWPAQDPTRNPNRANYGRGIAEATEILGTTDVSPGVEAPPPPIYNPGVPTLLQQESWTCSAYALAMALTSLGHDADPYIVLDSMGNILDPQVGLHYADGSELEQVIRRWGNARSDGITYNVERVPWQSHNGAGATYEEVLERAGEVPQLLGGRNWYHWVFVRRELPNGDLELGNPAPGWKSVGQQINRRQFDELGPMTLVRILPTEQIPQEDPAVIAELEQKVNDLVSALAYVCDDVGDNLVAAGGRLRILPQRQLTAAKRKEFAHEVLAAANEMRRVRRETIGERP